PGQERERDRRALRPMAAAPSPAPPALAAAAAAPPALTIDRVSKTFATADGPVAAIDSVSLDVAKGEFVAVIGPSGCGKSTLFNIVGGLIDGYEGRVLVDGAAPSIKREIGMVF